jgi:hypothetical protein
MQAIRRLLSLFYLNRESDHTLKDFSKNFSHTLEVRKIKFLQEYQLIISLMYLDYRCNHRKNSSFKHKTIPPEIL